MKAGATSVFRGMAAALLLAVAAPVQAGTYQINLFATPSGGVVYGVGGFDFTNSGAIGTFPVTLAALATTTGNPLTPVDTISFDRNISLTAATAPVDFFDGKAENNHTTGVYTEGAIGRLSSIATGHTIDFFFTAVGTDPATFGKTYEIRDVEGTLLQSGVYAVQNELTIPEPGTIAIFGLGLVMLAVLAHRSAGRGRRTGHRPPNTPA